MYSALIITPPIAAYICTSFLGWPWSYYIFGAQSFVGGFLWIYFGATSPRHHKTISIKERTFIENDLDQTSEVVSVIIINMRFILLMLVFSKYAIDRIKYIYVYVYYEFTDP